MEPAGKIVTCQKEGQSLACGQHGAARLVADAADLRKVAFACKRRAELGLQQPRPQMRRQRQHDGDIGVEGRLAVADEAAEGRAVVEIGQFDRAVAAERLAFQPRPDQPLQHLQRGGQIGGVALGPMLGHQFIVTTLFCTAHFVFCT